MDDETRKMLEEALQQADPELIEKFGNPLDENDPRTWTPTKRIENGVSVEDQIKYLGLDLESMTMLVASTYQKLAIISQWVAAKMQEDFLREIKENPEEAARKYAAMLGQQMPGKWGPLEDKPDASVRYAGSAKGIAPDQMVETPEGIIRADEIPGYRNDPEWSPSPDWAEANCMCPQHVSDREKAKNTNPFGIDPYEDGSGTGMYL